VTDTAPASLLTFLRKLSRRGALAHREACLAAAPRWSIALSREGEVTTSEPVDAAVAEAALEKGLVTAAAGDTWRLSRRGIDKLRGARHIADGPAAQAGIEAAGPLAKAPTASATGRAAMAERASATKARPRAGKPTIATPSEGSLDWLRSRRDASGAPLIGEVEYQAGLRLARDFEAAGMQPRVTAGWSGLVDGGGNRRGVPGAGVEIADRALAARARLEAALDDVGPDFAHLVLDICCFQIPLAVVEKDGRLPQRSAKVLLQYALRALARHYRMLPRESVRDRGPRVRHWGGEGYRPGMGVV